jgi:uncharacterized protein (UPF0335 family)
MTEAAEQIRAFVERIERMDAEIAEHKDDRKEVLAEAKGTGLDTKALLKIVALRKRNRDDVAEEEAILDLYKSALGMD